VGEEKCIRGWWWDHIKVYFEEMEWDKMDSIYMAQDRHMWLAVVNISVNCRVP
jgi:hypothetical protein